MSKESQNPGIEQELEARIVALVLGEASDFEVEELTRQIERRPELASFKLRMQKVHGLLQDVAASEFGPQGEDWKLSADRRNAVLAVIRGEATVQPAIRDLNLSSRQRVSGKRSLRWNLTKVAAVLCVAGFVGIIAMSSHFMDERAASEYFYAAAKTDAPHNEVTLSGGTGLGFARESESAGEDVKLYVRPGSGELNYRKNSGSALSAVQETLSGYATLPSPDYLKDDVQYLPAGPEFKLPDAVAQRGISESESLGRATSTMENGSQSTPQPADTSELIVKNDTTWMYRGQRDEDFVGKVDDPTSAAAPALPMLDVPEHEKLLLGTIEPPTVFDVAPSAGKPVTLLPRSITGNEEARVSDLTQGTRSLTETLSFPDAPRSGKESLDGENADLAKTQSGDPLEILPLQQEGEQVETRRKSGGPPSKSNGDRFRYALPALDDNSSSMKRPEVKTVATPAGLNEKTAAEEAFSTFSLHVSDVSFKLALAALERGEWPEAAKIRIEEFVNAFDYGDPLPGKNEKVACLIEQSIHPFVQQRNILRVSMRTAAEGRSSNTPLRLTFLLDNSGSMERADRQQTVRRAFNQLSQQLTPIDQVTLISFARQPRLLADKVSGSESGQLVRMIDELPSEGGTNIEAALQLAFEKAQEQQTPEAQNRIILLTDGAVNLGDADPESLSRMVSTMRDAGIAFDAAGISADGLNDEVLEALARKGDGRYYLLDSLEAADDGFARQIAGALRPSAKNVKVQIEFNPKRVGSYKLLGFEKHILNQEDFRNDSVDAAEMAAAEAGVALYQFEAKPDGEGDVGSVSVRFRDLSTGQMIENRWPIPYEADAPRPDQAAPSLRIAASAALLAAKLRGEPLGETVDLQTLSHLISSLPDHDRNNTRVQQLQLMIEQARQLSGK